MANLSDVTGGIGSTDSTDDDPSTDTTTSTDSGTFDSSGDTNKFSAYIEDTTFATETDSSKTDVGGSTTSDVIGNLESDIEQTGGEEHMEAMEQTTEYVTTTTNESDAAETAKNVAENVNEKGKNWSGLATMATVAIGGFTAIRWVTGR